jgi:hypothetical protein
MVLYGTKLWTPQSWKRNPAEYRLLQLLSNCRISKNIAEYHGLNCARQACSTVQALNTAYKWTRHTVQWWRGWSRNRRPIPGTGERFLSKVFGPDLGHIWDPSQRLPGTCSLGDTEERTRSSPLRYTQNKNLKISGAIPPNSIRLLFVPFNYSKGQLYLHV